MEANKIRERVYANTSGEGKGNIGAIDLENYTVIIDSTISVKTAKAFRESIAAIVKSPLRKLILTHYHADHVLGMPAFKDCDVIASEYFKKLRRTIKYHPKITFRKSMLLRDKDLTIEIIHSGGHTEDSSYMYFPHEKTLFSGDLIFSKTFFYAGDQTFNPEKWLEVLKHFSTMEIETIVPGHGPVCNLEEVKIYTEFFEETSSLIKELVKKGKKEKEIIECNKFPDFYPEYRKGLRDLALRNWYKFYKKRIN